MEIKARAIQNTLEAKVIRANGAVEDLGVIGYWHRNPLRRWLFWFKKRLEKLDRS